MGKQVLDVSFSLVFSEPDATTNLLLRSIAQETTDGWPADFGNAAPRDGLPHIPELLVAGAVSPLDPPGVVWDGTNSDPGGVPDVFAPGILLKTADGNEANWGFGPLKSSKGTSDGTLHTLTFVGRLSSLT